MNPSEHAIYKLRNARKLAYPFPHIYAESVFPADFYKEMKEQVSACREFVSGSKDYHGRTFADPNCIFGIDFMHDKDFARAIAKIFSSELSEHSQEEKIEISTDIRLVRDGKDYYIGPHTDAPWKLISLLFYLPPGFGFEQYGTSIYLPKDREFRCPGGPHHKFEQFDKIYTAPYAPNSCFGFWKTDNSFHGVEPVDAVFPRDVLLFNVYDQTIYKQTHPQGKL